MMRIFGQIIAGIFTLQFCKPEVFLRLFTTSGFPFRTAHLQIQMRVEAAFSKEQTGFIVIESLRYMSRKSGK